MQSTPATSLDLRLLADARKLGQSAWLLERPLVLGVSGGADSLALLHLLVNLRGTSAASTLHVAHLNHLLRGREAREDSEFVRRMAEVWGLSFTVAEFDVPAYARRKGLSTEDAARRARYAFLAALAQREGAAVAVAHNADDQVETVLMAILRGTGLTGLAGMQGIDRVVLTVEPELETAFPYEPAIAVELFRPLLGVWRHEIDAYCALNGLVPRLDSTNLDQSYRRNRIRHDLIPYLQQNYSLAVKDHISRLSQIAASEDALAAALAETVWSDAVIVDTSGHRVAFEIDKFAAQPDAVRRRLVRRALQVVAGTLADFTFAHVNAADDVLSRVDNAPPAMDLPHDVRIERTRGAGIIRMRDDAFGGAEGLAACGRPLISGTPAHVAPDGSVQLDGGWALETAVVAAQEAAPEMDEWNAAFNYDELTTVGPLVLRRRAAGDFLRPMGMTGRRSLQDLMVDAKIPRECRANLAVLAPEGSAEVLWVPGPGGRRSGYAPLTRDTRRVLEMRFIKAD